MTVAHSMYEQGMASLKDDLERIVDLLNAAGVAFEVIGGVAVNAHIMEHHRSRSFVTRDVDLLIRREDLEIVVASGREAGYEGRKIVGGHMLIRAGQEAGEAVHLFFFGGAIQIHTATSAPAPTTRNEAYLWTTGSGGTNSRFGENEADFVSTEGCGSFGDSG